MDPRPTHQQAPSAHHPSFLSHPLYLVLGPLVFWPHSSYHRTTPSSFSLYSVSQILLVDRQIGLFSSDKLVRSTDSVVSLYYPSTGHATPFSPTVVVLTHLAMTTQRHVCPLPWRIQAL